MKQNIGITGRYIRLVTGILALNCSANTQRRNYLGRSLLASFGAMKIAEGVIGWCPAVEICNRLFPESKSLANIMQDKKQKQPAKSPEPGHEKAKQTQQSHHADNPELQNHADLNIADPKIMQNDESHSETKIDSESDIEAF